MLSCLCEKPKCLTDDERVCKNRDTEVVVVIGNPIHELETLYIGSKNLDTLYITGWKSYIHTYIHWLEHWLEIPYIGWKNLEILYMG